MGKEAVVSGVTRGAVVSRTGPGGRSISREIWEAWGYWAVILLADGLLI
jgi:hypothetical protein